MLICEGCDNSGKSTLVGRLSGDLKLLVINNRKRPASAKASRNYLMGVLNLACQFPTIVDRWQPISEPIYGPICRDTRLLNFKDVESQHALTNVWVSPLVIYCRPREETILKFKEEIPQMEGVINHAPKIIQAYDDMMKWLPSRGIPVIRYDWEQDSYEALKDRVSKHLQTRDYQ